MSTPVQPDIQPEKILRDLRELWSQLGRDREDAGGVLRACAMTLLVTATNESDAENARRILGTLMHDHPSRAIVLSMRPDAAPEARVFAECWMPYGRHQQICSEGIELTADAGRMAEVARLLLPLLVPDLPVVLWCRGTSAFSDRALAPLFPLAEKIIFDSRDVPDARAAIEVLRGLRSQSRQVAGFAEGRRVADLAWTGITGWRHLVAQWFDDGKITRDDLQSVRITHGSDAPSSSVLYFAAWIRHAAPGARVVLTPAKGETGLRGVALASAQATLEIKTKTGTCVEVRDGDRRYHSPLPPLSEDALMGEELSILGLDAAFDQVLK